MKTCASSSWFVRKFKKPKQNSFKTISLRNFSDLILPIHQSPWRGSIWLSVCVCSSVIAHVIVVVLVVISACVRACAYSHPSKTSPTACMYVSREWSIRRRDVKEEPRYVRCVVIACRITWPGLLEKKQQQNNPSLRKTSWSSMFPCYYHHKYPLYCYVCLCATVRLRRCFVGVCGGSMLAICLLSVSCTPTNNIAMHVAFVTYCVL